MPALDDLTAREREILEVVAEGLDNYEIAARLDISEKTVRNHVSTIFSKLQIKSSRPCGGPRSRRGSRKGHSLIPGRLRLALD